MDSEVAPHSQRVRAHPRRQQCQPCPSRDVPARRARKDEWRAEGPGKTSWSRHSGNVRCKWNNNHVAHILGNAMSGRSHNGEPGGFFAGRNRILPTMASSKSDPRRPAASQARRPNAKDNTARATKTRSLCEEARRASPAMLAGSAQRRGRAGPARRRAAGTNKAAESGGGVGASPSL